MTAPKKPRTQAKKPAPKPAPKAKAPVKGKPAAKPPVKAPKKPAPKATQDTPTKRRRPTGTKTNAKAVESAERDAKALRMRVEDYTFDQIAEELKYADRASAYKAVQRRLTEIKTEAVDELRTVEDAKLSRGFREVFKVLNTEVEFGTIPEEFSDAAKLELIVKRLSEDSELKLKAVDRLDKLSKTRARLFGLEAPMKTEITGAGAFPISINPALLPDKAIEMLGQQEQ